MHTSGQGRVGWSGHLLITLIWCASLNCLQAQPILCNGNLGDNIFTEGNFGSGLPNIIQMDPGLAPGFMYTTHPPPDDGYYTITNDMRVWNSVFPDWISIGDNDIDPHGYMMVVNATFSPGIFYEKIINDLCENTRYEFSADIINLIRKGASGLIFPNVSFLIDDVVAYSTGNVPQDEAWHTYGFTFVTKPGQFAVKLSLRNNAPGGIGNDLALDNISFRSCGPESSISISPQGKICENSLFPILTATIAADTGVIQWQVSPVDQAHWTDIPGATNRTHQVQQVAAGIYYFRYLYANSTSALLNPNCRIESDALLVEVVPVTFLVRDTICEGLNVMFGDSIYTETGMYQQHLVASTGCDSIVTLDLEVVPDPHIDASFGSIPPSCEGADDGLVYLASISNIRPPYSFRVNDSILPPPNTALHVGAGSYTVWIETPYGCYDNENITVSDGPPLHIQTIPDTTVVLGHAVLVHTDTNLTVDSVSWIPSQEVGCPYCLDTYITPLDDETLIIQAFTKAGCVDEDSLTIRVDRTPVLFVPNVFTPNGDQINDEFLISMDPLNIKSINRVIIFDRWGGIIAEKADLMADRQVAIWDGTTPAGPAMPGTYVYLIQFTLADNSPQSQSGNVTVVK